MVTLPEWCAAPSTARLRRCLLLSAILHAAILVELDQTAGARSNGASRSLPLRASLLPQTAPANAVVPLLQDEPPARHLPRRLVRGAHTENQFRLAAPAKPGQAALVPVAKQPSPALAQVPDSIPRPAATEPAQSEGALAEISQDRIRQYRLSLAREARQFKQYPSLARERGWEGVAQFAVNADAAGIAPTVALIRSSGHTALDQQGLDMLSEAVRLVPLPEILRKRSFSVPIEVRFSLDP